MLAMCHGVNGSKQIPTNLKGYIMSSITVGLFLPSGVNVEPEPIFVEDYKSIQSAVGGTFDAITTNCGMEEMLFVGYVNDEFLINGMEMNYLATNLFKREIHGNCVVVWGLSEDGEYDGDNHDIPEGVYGVLVDGLTEGTASAYNLAVSMATICDFAIQHNISDEETLDRATFTMYDCSTNGDRSSERYNNAMATLKGMLDDVATFAEDNAEGIGELNADEMQQIAGFCRHMNEML